MKRKLLYRQGTLINFSCSKYFLCVIIVRRNANSGQRVIAMKSVYFKCNRTVPDTWDLDVHGTQRNVWGWQMGVCLFGWNNDTCAIFDVDPVCWPDTKKQLREYLECLFSFMWVEQFSSLDSGCCSGEVEGSSPKFNSSIFEGRRKSFPLKFVVDYLLLLRSQRGTQAPVWCADQFLDIEMYNDCCVF